MGIDVLVIRTYLLQILEEIGMYMNTSSTDQGWVNFFYSTVNKLRFYTYRNLFWSTRSVVLTHKWYTT